MKHTTHLLLLTSLLAFGQALAAPEYFSRYTSLEEHHCYSQQQHEEETRQWCPAFAGYQVMLSMYANLSLSLLKNNQEYVIGELIAEDTLGKQLEWRFVKQRSQNAHEEIKPVAVIFRGMPSSNLYVSKLTPQTSCLIAVVAPQADQNEVARDLADNAQNKPCLKL